MAKTPETGWAKVRHMLPAINLWHHHHHHQGEDASHPSPSQEKSAEQSGATTAASTMSKHSGKGMGEKLKNAINGSVHSLENILPETHHEKTISSTVTSEQSNQKNKRWSLRYSIDELMHRRQSRRQTRKRRGSDEKVEADPMIEDRVKIFIGTWNMFGQLPPVNLAPFVDEIREDNAKGPHLRKDNTHPYHIVVIATQECERDISEAVFFPSKEEWEERLMNYMTDSYTRIRSETMAALNLQVFVWSKVKDMVKEEQGSYIATGFANMIGNKGAVAISILFGDTSFLFVNSHLTAGQEKALERTNNFERICSDLEIKPFKNHPRHCNGLDANITNRYDHIFWCGDMNYRVDAPKAIAEAAITSGDYAELLHKDQLTIQRRTASIFKGFREAPIRFPPTYKFDTTDGIKSAPATPPEEARPNLVRSNSDIEITIDTIIPELEIGPSGFTKLPLHLTYDTSPKQRVPSWTDRILYKSTDIQGNPIAPDDNDDTHPIDCWRYQAMLNVKGVSDHRPVIGVFGVKFDWKTYLMNSANAENIDMKDIKK